MGALASWGSGLQVFEGLEASTNQCLDHSLSAVLGEQGSSRFAQSTSLLLWLLWQHEP